MFDDVGIGGTNNGIVWGLQGPLKPIIKKEVIHPDFNFWEKDPFKKGS